MPTYIRLTDYKSSDEKEQEFFNPENRYEAKQEDFSKIPSSPITYWISDNIFQKFQKIDKLHTIATPRAGMITGNNENFVKLWFETQIDKIGFNFTNREDAKTSGFKWFPYQKGGSARKWYGNNEYIVIWEDDGYLLKNTTDSKGKVPAHAFNEEYIYKANANWSAVSSLFTARVTKNGSLFDAGGSAAFPKNELHLYQLASFLNSKIANYLLGAINPTINYQAWNIGNLPLLINSVYKEEIETLTQQNIDISKEEWDSRETSWDFTQNEILRIKNEELKIENCKLEDAYNKYCEYWREKFFTLHKNEEELNRLFIDIYELQDELTPEVELKDITILKNEAKIEDGELVFQADEIIKQFISYGVGVMFGRYSLDSDGLLIANMGQDIPTSTTFEIDDDNIIPVLEDEYFDDDIASRFVEFVKVAFGDEHLKENVAFIEKSLGVSLRKYFVKGFYEDHIKRYKKRPIYWMVSSPKKGFMALMYMHRYQSDVFATVQNGYLREYIAKLEASELNYQREADDTSNSNVQRNRATKQVQKITKTLDEVIKFDREVLTSFAQNRVEIDLDDGVKVNYCRLKDILFPISGLCK